jgi:hypothetical protein
MRAVVVEVSPEIEQFVFEIYPRPEQHVRTVAGDSQARHYWMGARFTIREMLALHFR